MRMRERVCGLTRSGAGLHARAMWRKDGGRVVSFIFPGSSKLERSESFGSYIVAENKERSWTMAEAVDQVLSARRRTFTRWVNSQFKNTKLRVEDLEKDLASGVVLVRLLQTYSPHEKALGKYVS